MKTIAMWEEIIKEVETIQEMIQEVETIADYDTINKLIEGMYHDKEIILNLVDTSDNTDIAIGYWKQESREIRICDYNMQETAVVTLDHIKEYFEVSL